MRQRLQVFTCLFAWLVATGCQWDLAQLIAWSRMFASYAQEMTLTAAAEQTFSGEMCHLCKAVQKGRQEQDQNAPKSTMAGKAKVVDAAPLAEGVTVLSPQRQTLGLVPARKVYVGRDRMAPPLPPPRVTA